MEYLTKDTFLSFSETKEGTYKELYGLSSFPRMGGVPAKKDVSNMRDSMHRGIAGLQEVDNLEFGFFYNKKTDTDEEKENMVLNSFSELKKLEKTKKPVFWKLTYPDDSSYSWQGKPTPIMDSGEVDAPIKFTLSVSLETTLEYNDGTSTEG